MMLEFITERIMMQGEMARIALALIGTGIAAWYDVKNNRNVPNNFLYAFLALAFLANVAFYQQELFFYTIVVATSIFAFGYLFYKMGYIGGADVYVLASIALLLPVFPSYAKVLFNFPVVLSIIVSSGVLFALYFLYFIFKNIVLKDGKGKYEYALLLPPYAVLLYFFISSGVFGLAYIITVSVLIISSIVFMIYKESVTAAMAAKVPLSKVEDEDIAVLELMPEAVKKHGIKRLLDKKELERLKKAKVKEIYVYRHLPPFLPFILAGLAISVTVGDMLMYSIRT